MDIKTERKDSSVQKKSSAGTRISGILGWIMLLLGILVIFLSAALNAVHNAEFDAHSNLSHEVYIFDIISTVGVILIPVGLVLLLRREIRKPGEKIYLN